MTAKTTKPAELSRADVLILMAMFEATSGGEAFDETQAHVYPQLVRLESEYRHEQGAMQ